MNKIHEVKHNQIALNLSQAASALGISRPTLSRLIKSGEIRSKRVGRRHLVPRAELERFLEGDDDR